MQIRNWCFVAAVGVLAAVSNGSSDAPAGHSAAPAKPAAHAPAPAPAHGDSKPAAPAAHADPHAAAAQADATTGPTPDDAMRMLIEGNERYLSSLVEHPRSDTARRCDTFSNGQHPFASILSCADSRVPLELLFDQGIGDLFAIRVAGNVADTDEIGTIEYGAGHLHTPLIVVLGHTKCGAVTAVVQEAKVSENIAKLVDNIVPAVATARKNLPGAKGETLVQAAIDANVFQAMADLVSRSEEVRELIAENKVKVVGAVYDIHMGSVRWLGEHPRQADLLKGTLATAKPGDELLHGAAAKPAPAAKPKATPSQSSAAANSKPASDPHAKPNAAASHAAPAAAQGKDGDKPHAKPAPGDTADASSDAAHPQRPHETGTLKGMVIPGVFLGGAGLASSVMFHFMKPRKPAASAAPAKEAAASRA